MKGSSTTQNFWPSGVSAQPYAWDCPSRPDERSIAKPSRARGGDATGLGRKQGDRRPHVGMAELEPKPRSKGTPPHPGGVKRRTRVPRLTPGHDTSGSAGAGQLPSRGLAADVTHRWSGSARRAVRSPRSRCTVLALTSARAIPSRPPSIGRSWGNVT